MEINHKNKAIHDSHYVAHVKDGGKMPNEFALTELVYDSIKNKSYVFIGNQKGIHNFSLFDVVAFSNMSHDVEFGVLTEIDSNVLFISKGTATGVFQYKIES